MITRIYQRIRALAFSAILAIHSKLVPSALDRAVSAFTKADGMLARAEASAKSRLNQEVNFRRTLTASENASWARSDAAASDIRRANRIRTRLASLLD